MPQSKEVAYSFEKLTHKMSAIICQEEDGEPASYDPIVVKDIGNMRPTRYEV